MSFYEGGKEKVIPGEACVGGRGNHVWGGVIDPVPILPATSLAKWQRVHRVCKKCGATKPI